MNEIQPKPNEVMQAQVAAFAMEAISNRPDVGHLLSNIGEIAVGQGKDITRVLNQKEYHDNEHGRFQPVEAGTEHAVATHAEYVAFLRQNKKSGGESISARATLLQAYEPFESRVALLKQELQDPAQFKADPNFLGSGLNSSAFKLEQDGKTYVVRLPNGGQADPGSAEGYVSGGILGKGVPGLEQFVAASYEDGVAISELMPGKEMNKLTAEDMRAITDEQLGQWVDTLTVAHARGIEIDPKPTNFFYDKQTGFGVIDYSSSKVASKNSGDQTLGTIVGWMETSLSSAGFYAKKYRTDRNAEDFSDDWDRTVINRGIAKRYRDIVAQKLDGADREEALTFIDDKLAKTEEYEKPESKNAWIAQRIAEQAQSVANAKAMKEKIARGKTGWDTADGAVMELDLI